MQDEERLRRIEQFTDAPLMVLAVLFIPVLVIPMLFEPPESLALACEAGEWIIWAIFAVVLILKVSVAPQRTLYLRRNWLEVLIVVVPFLRPLRLLRVARVAVVLGVNTEILGRLAGQKGLRSIVLATLSVIVAGGTLALAFEHRAEGSNMTTFGDAIWWAFVTSTTVGYGDAYPVTAAGRGIAIALMLLGIAALSGVTASVAAFLTRESQPDDRNLETVLVRIAELQDEIAALRRELEETR